MLELYYSPGTASVAPHIALEEIGAEYTLHEVDITQGEHHSTAYLALNPNGVIPVFRNSELVLYESAAICLYLADTFPAALLAPPFNTADRAHYYKWMVWLSATLQPALNVNYYSKRWVNSADAIVQIERNSMKKAQDLLRQIDAQLAEKDGRWLLGSQYSMADIYAFMLCRWTSGFSAQRARDFEHIGKWLIRMVERPAVQRVLEREALDPPY